MKRSLKDRKIHSVVAKYHTSKNWRFPEQCPAHFREPLAKIATGVTVYCGLYKDCCVKRPRKLYHSPMIEQAHEEFYWLRLYSIQSFKYVFNRLERDGYDYRGVSFEKNSSNRRDSKRGADIDYKSDALDCMDIRENGFFDYEFHDVDDYDWMLDKPNTKRKQVAIETELCWFAKYKESVMKDFPKNLPEAKLIKKQRQMNMMFDERNRSQLELGFIPPINQCPEDGRFVENEDTRIPTYRYSGNFLS